MYWQTLSVLAAVVHEWCWNVPCLTHTPHTSHSHTPSTPSLLSHTLTHPRTSLTYPHTSSHTFHTLTLLRSTSSHSSHAIITIGVITHPCTHSHTHTHTLTFPPCCISLTLTDLVDFTDEEGYGKYLDLHHCYDCFVNLKQMEVQ